MQFVTQRYEKTYQCSHDVALGHLALPWSKLAALSGYLYSGLHLLSILPPASFNVFGLLASSPLFYQSFVNASHKYMDMLNRSDALPLGPVPEPHDLLLLTLGAFQSWLDLGFESTVDEGVDPPSHLRSWIAGLVYLNHRLQPYDEVGNIRRHAVRPVISDDTVVVCVSERRRIDRGDRLLPFQKVLKNVGCDRAICRADVICKINVVVEIRRNSSQKVELIIS